MTYDSAWDLTHEPGPEPHWQESDCYWFLDTDQLVGGFHRIGYTPNRRTAHIMLFAFAYGAERYLNTRPATPDDIDVTPARRRVERHTAETLGDQRMRYTWDEPDCAAELEFYESFYTPRDWHQGPRTDVDDVMNPGGHLECSGRLCGNIRIGPIEYRIDALAHRDRSWGAREWKATGQCRMYSGTVGPALSWATYAFQMRDSGDWVRTGFVARDGATEQVVDVRVLATIDNDGYTAVGGQGELGLESGERLVIPCRPVQSMLTAMEDFAATDTLSLVDHDGHRGFVDMELLINPGRGPFLHVPTQRDLTLACAQRGLSRSAQFDHSPIPDRGGHA